MFQQSQLIDPESLDDVDEKYSLAIRNGFVRKVYGILFSQVALTTIVGALMTLSLTWRNFAIYHQTALSISAVIGTVVPLFCLMCIPGLAEKHPANIFLLATFTIFESILLGTICATVSGIYGSSVVLQAFCITALMVLGLTLIAFQSTYDFTSCASFMFLALLGFAGFGMLRLLFPVSPFIETVYALIGAAIFSVYIIIDTQMLIGRKGARKVISTDQYIMVALSLYLDFINLFLEILQLLSESQNSRSQSSGY